jgi:beta-mannosidase
VASASKDVTLTARSTARIQAPDLPGQFFDFTCAYRFGSRAHDVTVITLRDKVSGDVLSEAFHVAEHACMQRHELGLEFRVKQTTSENRALEVSAKRLARRVHIVDPHYRATLDWFHLSPGRERRIPLVGRQRNTSHPPEGEVRALNATFSIHCHRD